MLTRRMFGTGASALLLSGCKLLGLRWSYRYRLTVEVEDHGVLRTGSSVIEVVRDKGYNGIGGKARGEAVTVDLGNGDMLFAILKGHRGGEDWPLTMPHYAFAKELGGSNMVDESTLAKLEAMTGHSAVLDVAEYPMFVRFQNLSDPSSVEEVHPENLSASFGSGITLQRVSVEITDDPLSTGLVARLPWLAATHGGYINGATTSRTAPLGLHGGNFSTEINN